MRLSKRGVLPRHPQLDARSPRPIPQDDPVAINERAEITKQLALNDPEFNGQWHLYNTREVGHDLNVTCTKEGYQPATVAASSKFTGATFGNVIAGGFVGVAVDAASGANNRYPSEVKLDLVENAAAHVHGGAAIFAGTGLGHGAAERLSHHLEAVANAEGGQAQLEDLWVELRSAVLVHGRWAARQHERNRVLRLQFLGQYVP